MTPSIPAAAAVLLLAAAVLVAGGRHGSHRLRALHQPPPATDQPAPPLRVAWVAVGAGAAGALALTIGGPVAALVVTAAAVAADAVTIRHTDSASGPALELPSDLAAAWELLAVCLEAGLPVAVALAASAETLHGAVGVRLRRVSGLLELGADAAEAWRTADDLPPVAAFARAAGRSAATGAALATAARAEGARLRAELTETAQGRAERAGVLITAPLGLCFLPAFLVLGIAPVVAGLAGEVLAQW